MKKLLIMAGSNSGKSINKIFATYAGSLVKDVEKTVLDLNDFEMPIYSPEREEKNGVHPLAKNFIAEIESSDGIILSLAEYNGSYSTAFKNILDWSSRHKQKLWSDKVMLLLSTSPGGRGGMFVLEAAKQTFPHLGAEIAASFSLPSFFDNFKPDTGFEDVGLMSRFNEALETFTNSFS